jgi:hypothetical protein
MEEVKYWVIRELEQDCYYRGYYQNDLPVFSMAIADSIHIGNLDSATTVYNVLNKIIPCDILCVESSLLYSKVTKVFP